MYCSQEFDGFFMFLHSSGYQNNIVFSYALRVQIIQSTYSLQRVFNMDTYWLTDGLGIQENYWTEDEI